MVVLNGFVKLHRKLIQWGWYQDNVVKGVFLHLLLTASFRDSPWQGRTIKAGQVVTSYRRLAEDLGFGIRQVRTALEKLRSTGEVTSEATNRYQVITIVNWEEYQCFEEGATSKNANRETNDRQAVSVNKLLTSLKGMKEATSKATSTNDLETLINTEVGRLEAYLQTSVSAPERQASDNQETINRQHRKNVKEGKEGKEEYAASLFSLSPEELERQKAELRR